MLGTSIAVRLAERDHLDVTLFDRDRKGDGRATDINEGSPILGSYPRMRGANDFDDTSGSDIVIEASGTTRQPGESREAMLGRNLDNTRHLVKETFERSPDAVLIVFTNPLDVITDDCYRVRGGPRSRVMGSAVADTLRLQTFIGIRIGVSPSQVTAMIIGSHTDDFVWIPEFTTVAGIPISEFLSRSELASLIKATAAEGARLVDQTGRGAFVAPAVAAAQLVDAVSLDMKICIPACVRLQGEYGLTDVSVSVPCIVGAGGIERILEVELGQRELSALRRAADGVRRVVSRLPNAGSTTN